MRHDQSYKESKGGYLLYIPGIKKVVPPVTARTNWTVALGVAHHMHLYKTYIVIIP